jgi:hypothetical protein
MPVVMMDGPCHKEQTLELHRLVFESWPHHYSCVTLSK